VTVLTQCPPSLLRDAAAIRQLLPDEQTIPYYVERWAARLGDSSGFAVVASQFPLSVSRADLRSLGRFAIKDEQLLTQLFIATMIFGFGTIGYGPYRTSVMLADLARQPDALRTVCRLLVAEELARAHAAFDIQRCRTPFLSKFMYAVGLGAGLTPMPLILDNRVYRALDVLHERAEIDQWRYYTRVAWTSEGYAEYVRDVNRWAAALDCTPDQVEMYLFQHAGALP
jgi:hypothetical protein